MPYKDFFTDGSTALPGDGTTTPAFPAYEYNGTTWDRAYNGSAANLGAQTSKGATLVARPGEWSVTHVPAANTQATASKAAGAAGVRHVCTSIAATLASNASLAATQAGTVNLRDGATGAGTILWSQQITIPNVVGQQAQIVIGGLNIPGTAATAMTLEFSAASGAGTLQSVAITGYDAS